ncbi:putative two-component histidine kinase [Streptomyces sp. NBRC 110611]|uniref:sensor histidine kinase n=1 Tax=Streptomyces sp. NBRC 110611 TaxID=1621259 RepID=UPI00082C7A0E|nr:sensor histidine kinase [Streptomyces sp. NBRC 110611]GAU69936.1 putative two-component histidine kinase [Streptomyces sp. NBRC 110611]
MHIPPRLRRALTRLNRDTAFLALGAPLHLFMGFLLFMIFGLGMDTLMGRSSDAPVVLGFALVLTVFSVPALTAAQCWRFRQVLGIDIPRSGWQRPWRQFGYHCLAGALFGGLEALVVGLLLAGVAASLTFVWIYALPWQWRLEHIGYTTQVGYVSVAGLLALAVVPALAAALVRLESQVVPTLLGRSREEDLARRVEDLTASRAGAVDAADAERRRIERDLHDGAQQRLVSLALNLGLAKATLTDLPPEAREVIDAAHREAKEAIEELSSLVRGLHPAVLDELGLDAALSGLAARAPLPVRLRVDLPQRLTPAVEAVAYFVASEALTNVAKHAREATRADVTVTRLGGILRVVIADDGAGGADPSKGSGLTGLAQRVRSVDGTFRMSSPVGGPTVMSVELPCPM